MERLCTTSVHKEVVLESCLWSGYVPAKETYALGSLFTPCSYLAYVADSERMKQDNALPTTLRYWTHNTDLCIHITPHSLYCHLYATPSQVTVSIYVFYLQPQTHTHYHDGTMNYCRNFEYKIEPKPWCYTMDPSTRWEVCRIPMCTGEILLRAISTVVRLNII